MVTVTKFRALKFIFTPSYTGFEQRLLDFGADELERQRADGQTAVFLIRSDDLAKLRQSGGEFADRGRKNEHKGLSEYLLSLPSNKISIIDGNYCAAKQLKRSIRTFFLAAQAKSKTNLFVIGVIKTVFDEVWAVSNPERKFLNDADAALTSKYPAEWDGKDNTGYELLMELVQRCNVPKELEDTYVGKSWRVDLVRRLIVLAAMGEVPVLILGDTGTGKEIVARSIHKIQKGNTACVITVNCGGIPETLFESELYGYEKGAFTDAKGAKKGLWELAEGGTLFLDEIGELSLYHQAKLLRALEDHEIRRLGGTRQIHVNARIIAATNRDLFSMVRRGQFRKDLYYRLRGFLIHTPALREHREDIPAITNHLWKKITNGNYSLPTDILEKIKFYNWPGNSRELKMVLNHLYTLFGRNELRVKHLEYVFYIQGRGVSIEKDAYDLDNQEFQWADSWHHLRKVEDVISAAQFCLEPVMKGTLNAEKSNYVKTSLKLYLRELEALCCEHGIFHKDRVFSSVWQFKENLKHFLEVLAENTSGARRFWRETLNDEFIGILKYLSRESGKISNSA